MADQFSGATPAPDSKPEPHPCDAILVRLLTLHPTLSRARRYGPSMATRSTCNRMWRRLQPYVTEAATLGTQAATHRHPGCNPM